jgi:hypothetical protein
MKDSMKNLSSLLRNIILTSLFLYFLHWKEYKSIDKDNLQAKVQEITEEFKMEKEPVLKAFRTVVYQAPMKLHCLALFIALLNAQSYEMAKEFINVAASLLNEGLEKSSFRKVKLLTRFFAELVNCNVVPTGNLVKLLDQYLYVGKEEMVRQERLDAYLYVVLTTIPWVDFKLIKAAVSLRNNCLIDLERIYSEVEQYMTERNARLETSGIQLAHEILSAYKSNTEPYLMQDVLIV